MHRIQPEGEIFLPFEPKPGQMGAVGRQQDGAEGRMVMAGVLHGITSAVLALQL